MTPIVNEPEPVPQLDPRETHQGLESTNQEQLLLVAVIVREVEKPPAGEFIESGATVNRQR